MEPAEKSAPGPGRRQPGWLALVVLLWVGLIAALGCGRFAAKPAAARECEVHHVSLTRAKVPVRYWRRYYYSTEFREAFRREFPHSQTCVTKSSNKTARSILYLITSMFDRYDWLWVCPKCLEARKNWTPKHPDSKLTDAEL